MPYLPWFPPPGSYIRSFDWEEKRMRYRKLIWARDPLKYPYRFPALASGVKQTSPTTFKEIQPSRDKRHIYLAYLGVKPGCRFYLYHPVDVKNLKWDEQILIINEDLVANVTYEESPYEYPTKRIAIEYNRFPGVQPMNITERTLNPAIVWIAAQYYVQEDKGDGRIPDADIQRLEAGAIHSFPWDVGGEI